MNALLDPLLAYIRCNCMIGFVVLSKLTLVLYKLLRHEVAALQSKLICSCTFQVPLDGNEHFINLNEYLQVGACLIPVSTLCATTNVIIRLHVKTGILFYALNVDTSYREDLHCVWVGQTHFAKSLHIPCTSFIVLNPPREKETIHITVKKVFCY